MARWRLTPIAEAHDGRWQNRRIWREVVVQASSAAQARLVAAELEMDPSEPLSGNESPSFRSGFLDEKLYRVDRHGDGEGEPAILRAAEGVLADLREP
jgi:hypothetical protein